ncbi:MAG: WG repeat-containing protein, partial [Bacteroidota bacterium]|nr:WG repeat-containing protein [Bacteroidota bacterium]
MNKKFFIFCFICVCFAFVSAQPNYNVCLDFKYDSIFALDSNYFAIRENNLWGIAKDNKVIVPCKYECIDAFGNGVVTIIENQKAGFIDLEGNQITPPQYFLQANHTTYKSPLNVFSFNSALVFDGEKLLLIGKDGKSLVEKDIEILSKTNNTVIYKKNSAYGLMDAEGKPLTEAKYLQIQPVIDGKLYGYIGMREGMRVWGLLDEKGQLQSKAYFDELQVINKGDRFFVKAFMPSGKQALFDEDGNLLFQPFYQSIEPTIYPNYFDVTENTKHGIVDLDYILHVPTAYEQVQVTTLKEDTFFVAINDGVSFVLNKKNQLLAYYEGHITGFVSYSEDEVVFVADSFLNYGVMSSKKGWIIPPKYLDVLGCVNNSVILKKGKKWGAMNLQGNEVVPFEYNKVKVSSNRNFVVFYDGKKNSILLNDKGEKQVFPKVKKMFVFSNHIEYKDKKNYVRLYATGQEKTSQYLDIGNEKDNILLVKDKKGWTYVNASTLEPLTDKHFDNISSFINKRALVVKDKELLLIDDNFNTLSTLITAKKSNLHTAMLI